MNCAFQSAQANFGVFWGIMFASVCQKSCRRWAYVPSRMHQSSWPKKPPLSFIGNPQSTPVGVHQSKHHLRNDQGRHQGKLHPWRLQTNAQSKQDRGENLAVESASPMRDGARVADSVRPLLMGDSAPTVAP